MKLTKIATTIVILCAFLFLSVSCSSEETSTVKTQDYTVTKGSISVSITGTGNLALSRTENLAFEMAGTVAEVLVTEGETVTKGQELVKLDVSEWETQLKTLEKAVTSAQRTLTAKEKALATAEQAVTTKEEAVTTAERQITSKELAVSQAELDLKTAEYNLNQIDVVKDAQDEIDNAEYALKFAKSMLAGEFGGGVQLTDYAYWTNLRALAEEQLVEAKANLQDILSDTGITLSTDVALQIAKYQLAVTKAQVALDDANAAIDTAKAAITDAEREVEDAKSDVQDAQLDVEDAKTALADAQDDLDEVKSLSPVITAPFDGFISKINVEGGDDILKGTVALVIADPNQFEAQILVSEDDISSVKLGGEATVSITALSDVSLPAEVTKISPTASVSSGVVNYSVTVNITSLQPITSTQATAFPMPAQTANGTMPSGMPSGNFTPPDGMPSGNFTPPSDASQITPPATTTSNATSESVSLRDGLSAVVEIISQQKSDILIVPSKAITRKNQQYTVEVVNGDTTETRVVTTGITDGSYTEITDGLTEGEKVRIQTSSTSSSTSSSSSMPNPQMGIQSIGGGSSGGPPGGF